MTMKNLLFIAAIFLQVSPFSSVCHAFTPSQNAPRKKQTSVRSTSPKTVRCRPCSNSLHTVVNGNDSQINKSIFPVHRQSVEGVYLYSQASGTDGVEEVGGDDEKKITFRQKLRKMGTQVVLSYGFVSNMGMAATVALTWYVHSVRTGISPIAPGQKKGFLAVYSGFYLFMNVIRPARFALAVVVSKYFDRAVKSIQRRLNVSKGLATFFLVLIANIFGTCVALALGVSLASAASGVPIWRTQ